MPLCKMHKLRPWAILQLLVSSHLLMPRTKRCCILTRTVPSPWFYLDCESGYYFYQSGNGGLLFTGSIASPGTSTNSGSVAHFYCTGNTFPIAFNNFGSGGYNFTSPVLFTGRCDC